MSTSNILPYGEPRESSEFLKLCMSFRVEYEISASKHETVWHNRLRQDCGVMMPLKTSKWTTFVIHLQNCTEHNANPRTSRMKILLVNKTETIKNGHPSPSNSTTVHSITRKFAHLYVDKIAG